MGSGVEVGDDFGPDVDGVDLAVEGSQVVELVALEGDVVGEFFAPCQIEAGAGEEDSLGGDAESREGGEAFW